MEFIVSIAILQLGLLLFIAAALLLYLICRIPSDEDNGGSGSSPGSGKTVLVTSCDCAIGLQVRIYNFFLFTELKNKNLVPYESLDEWRFFKSGFIFRSCLLT